MPRTALVAILLFTVGAVFADDLTFEISIQDHRFLPSELTIAAGTKVLLVVINHDATPEEFESHSLHREKVIPGNSRAIIRIGPLDPGTYEFMGEFHADTARGSLIVK